MIRRTFATLLTLASLALAGCTDAAPERLTAPEGQALAEVSPGGGVTAPGDAGYGAYVTGVSVNCPGSVYVGEPGYCTAMAHYSDGSTSYGAESWFSSNPAVLSVYGGGMVYGASPGTASAGASVGGVTGYASVTVRQPPTVTTIAVSPDSAAVYINGIQQFTAKVYDQHGNQMSNPVGWSVDNPAIATIDASGVVTGVALGSTTVRASANGVSGTAVLVVRPSVTVSGPQTANHQEVTVTAQVSPAGTYHYTWLTKRCTVSGPCENALSVQAQGTNLTSYTDFVSRHDIGLTVGVQIRAYAGGPVLAGAGHYILGEAVPQTGPGSCAPRLIC